MGIVKVKEEGHGFMFEPMTMGEFIARLPRMRLSFDNRGLGHLLLNVANLTSFILLEDEDQSFLITFPEPIFTLDKNTTSRIRVEVESIDTDYTPHYTYGLNAEVQSHYTNGNGFYTSMIDEVKFDRWGSSLAIIRENETLLFLILYEGSLLSFVLKNRFLDVSQEQEIRVIVRKSWGEEVEKIKTTWGQIASKNEVVRLV